MMNALRKRFGALGGPFWLLWSGETIVMFGNQLVQFAVGIWILQKTNSNLSFAIGTAASILPGLLLLPIAGAVVDNMNRFRIVIVANCLSGCLMATFLVITWSGALTVNKLYAFAVMASAIGAFQGPAYQALVASIVRPDLLTRASGTMGVTSNSLAIVAPSMAGAIFAASGLSTLLTIDLVTFMIGVGMVWNAFRIGSASLDGPTADKGEGLWTTVSKSFEIFGRAIRFIAGHPGLRLLSGYVLLQSCFLAFVLSLVVPLILSMHSTVSLGMVMSAGAVGGLIGSTVMAVLDAPKRPVRVILGCDAIIACCVIAIAFSRDIMVFCAIETIAGCAVSIASTCSFSLWMVKVPEKTRGSVFALMTAVGMFTSVAMVLAGGVLAERFFEPIMRDGVSGLGAQLGALLGNGNGRGMALMFLLSGTLAMLMSIAGLAYRPLREFR